MFLIVYLRPTFLFLRALELSPEPAGKEETLASLAVCAGFDMVKMAADGHVTVYVIGQDGYRAQNVEFLEGVKLKKKFCLLQ